MSAEAMPVEILVMILRNVSGTDAAACRAVCRRWRDVVDSFTDDVWKLFCYRDFWDPKTAKDASNLSYRDLYKSLALWDKVETAEENWLTEPIEDVLQVKVLNNAVVAMIKYSDVDYYNIQTMKLITIKIYDFVIMQYHENEKLIVMLDVVDQVNVIIKPNDKIFVVGDLKTGFCFFCTLLDTGVYFNNDRDMISVARLMVVDGEETMVTEELPGLEERAIEFADAGDDGVNILTEVDKIYCYRNKSFKYCSQIDRRSPTMIQELWNFGFHWSILYERSYGFLHEQQQTTKLKPLAIHAHNHVVLLGTGQHTVHVYKRPYEKNGELTLYKARPDRIIDMTKYFQFGSNGENIMQLDVVEILNGHRLLVLSSSYRLFCIDLTHN